MCQGHFHFFMGLIRKKWIEIEVLQYSKTKFNDFIFSLHKIGLSFPYFNIFSDKLFAMTNLKIQQNIAFKTTTKSLVLKKSLNANYKKKKKNNLKLKLKQKTFYF